MALTPADDDPYMQEVKKLTEMAQATGSFATQMLYGKEDLFFQIERG